MERVLFPRNLLATHLPRPRRRRMSGLRLLTAVPAKLRSRGQLFTLPGPINAPDLLYCFCRHWGGCAVRAFARVDRRISSKVQYAKPAALRLDAFVRSRNGSRSAMASL